MLVCYSVSGLCCPPAAASVSADGPPSGRRARRGVVRRGRTSLSLRSPLAPPAARNEPDLTARRAVKSSERRAGLDGAARRQVRRVIIIFSEGKNNNYG